MMRQHIHRAAIARRPVILLDAAAALVAGVATIPLHEEFHKVSLLVMGAKGNVEHWGVFGDGFCGFTVSPSQFPWFCLAGGLGVFFTYMALWSLLRKKLWLTGWVILGVAIEQMAFALWEWRMAA